MENIKFVLILRLARFLLFPSLVGFYHGALAQMNIVPNGDMENGGSPSCYYPAQCGNCHHLVVNPNIYNWVNARWNDPSAFLHVSPWAGSFDWWDWNYAQTQPCNLGIWANYNIPPVLSNRWIGVFGTNPNDPGAFRGEVIRVQLTYPLRKGTYTLKMKAAFTGANSSFSAPTSNLKIRIHITKLGEEWFKDGPFTDNVFIKDITNFSLDKTQPETWQQFQVALLHE